MNDSIGLWYGCLVSVGVRLVHVSCHHSPWGLVDGETLMSLYRMFSCNPIPRPSAKVAVKNNKPCFFIFFPTAAR